MFNYELMKKKRKEKKITQEEIANLLGVSQPMVNKYEKGLSAPKNEARFILCKALEVSFADLFGENPFDAEEPSKYKSEFAFESYLEHLGYDIKKIELFEEMEYEEEDGTTTIENEKVGIEYKISKGDIYITVDEKRFNEIKASSKKNIDFIMWDIYNEQWK